MDYPRLEINRNMRKPNLSLITTRQTREPFAVLATNLVCGQHKIVSVYDGSYVFPLWIYPTEQEQAFGMERRANIAPAFLAEMAARVGETPTPEEVFHYAYAVFHAPTYRTRYAAFLKTDFPRLPLPPDAETFHVLTALGAKLTALHLMEAPELKQHGIGFPVAGGHVVQKMRREERYVPGQEEESHPAGGGSSGRVQLNETEYFENVPPEAWKFQVGGYQPAFKWLDDRKGRALSEDDITHYRRMLAAMRETEKLLPTVDSVFVQLLKLETTGDSLASAPKGLPSV
jgi:predicted helicase